MGVKDVKGVLRVKGFRGVNGRLWGKGVLRELRGSRGIEVFGCLGFRRERSLSGDNQKHDSYHPTHPLPSYNHGGNKGKKQKKRKTTKKKTRQKKKRKKKGKKKGKKKERESKNVALQATQQTQKKTSLSKRLIFSEDTRCHGRVLRPRSRCSSSSSCYRSILTSVDVRGKPWRNAQNLSFVNG